MKIEQNYEMLGMIGNIYIILLLFQIINKLDV